jgi:hypothetical protein
MRRTSWLVAISATAFALVFPIASHADGIISALSLSPDTVRAGAPSVGTVSLAFPDAAPTTALLFSSDTTVASVPPSVVIPAGSTAASFTITTNASAPPTIVQLTAAIGNVPRTANLSVNAATPPGPTLSAVSVTPSSVTGGSPATGTVTFSGVTDGAIVQLSSSNTSVMQVPVQTVVSGGASSAAFAVTTSPVLTTTKVSIIAQWTGITRTTTLTVSPGAPAAADRVTITKARWKARLLTIQATGSNPTAILSVYLTATNGFMFELTNNGGGRYSDQRGMIFDPVQITVRSNLGGSATAFTTH